MGSAAKAAGQRARSPTMQSAGRGEKRIWRKSITKLGAYLRALRHPRRTVRSSHPRIAVTANCFARVAARSTNLRRHPTEEKRWAFGWYNHWAMAAMCARAALLWIAFEAAFGQGEVPQFTDYPA